MTEITLTTIALESREALGDFKDEHQPIIDGITGDVQWQMAQDLSGYLRWTLHCGSANDAAMALAHLTSTLIDKVAYMVSPTDPKRIKAGRREKHADIPLLHREDGPAFIHHDGPHPGRSLWFNSPQNKSRPRLTVERFFLFGAEMFERDMPAAIQAMDDGADEFRAFLAWREEYYGAGVANLLRGGI